MTSTNPTVDTAVRTARGTGLGHPSRGRTVRDQLARVIEDLMMQPPARARR